MATLTAVRKVSTTARRITLAVIMTATAAEPEARVMNTATTNTATTNTATTNRAAIVAPIGMATTTMIGRGNPETMQGE